MPNTKSENPLRNGEESMRKKAKGNKTVRHQKKAQLFDQIFVYILMLIVFSSILLFGFIAIKKLLGQADTIDRTRFQSDLKGMIDSNIHYGTTEVKILSVPGDYREICFIDACVYKNGTDQCPINMSEAQMASVLPGITLYNHPKIENVLSGYSPSNVFLYPNGPDFYIGELKVDPDPLDCDIITNSSCVGTQLTPAQKSYDCMPIINGQVKLKLFGLGNRVQVTYLQFAKG